MSARSDRGVGSVSRGLLARTAIGRQAGRYLARPEGLVDNEGMQSLRRMTRFARLVLAWFVLSVGVAIAAPAVQPQALQMVCSGGAMKLVTVGDEAGPAASATLDCPLCAPFHALPPASRQALRLADPLPLAAAVPADPPARPSAAPAPARGPPAAARLS